MPNDVYRPPSSTLTQETAPRTATPGHLDAQRALAEGWRDMRANFPLWLGVGIVFQLTVLGSALTLIGLFVLVPVLAWGAVHALLRMHDGGGRFADLFSGFERYGSALVASVAWYLCNLVISLMLRLSFAYFYIVDQRMDAIEAYRSSWTHTRGQGFQIFLLFVASIAIGVAGFFLLVVGLIPASAVMMFAWASAYRQISGTAE
jgi:uncharacterized membrane protein